MLDSPFIIWYARLDSNQRLSAPEADALSSELRALFAQGLTAIKLIYAAI